MERENHEWHRRDGDDPGPNSRFDCRWRRSERSVPGESRCHGGDLRPYDQRGAGFPCIIDGTVYSGAYEVQNPLEIPTTTALSTSATSLTFGQSVTLTATVSDSSGGVPKGSVEFYDGPTDLGQGTYVGGSGDSATWTFTTSTLPQTTPRRPTAKLSISPAPSSPPADYSTAIR
jgi:Bacterial Ig-like domain (group 3)